MSATMRISCHEPRSADYRTRIEYMRSTAGFTRQQVAFWAKLVQQVGLAGRQ